MRRAALAAAVACAALLGPATAALAHSSDEYAHNTYVSADDQGVKVEMHLTPGALVAGRVVSMVDADGDGTTSRAEADAYARLLERDVSVRVDGAVRPLTTTAITVAPTDLLRAGAGEIVWTAFAPGAPPDRPSSCPTGTCPSAARSRRRSWCHPSSATTSR